jgi:large subunit ribosomal protein L13
MWLECGIDKTEKVKVEKTYVPKGQTTSEWYLIDAAGEPLGRLATQIAGLLVGNTARITHQVCSCDHVVVINAAQVSINPTRQNEKVYYHHSGYPRGMKAVKITRQMVIKPEAVFIQQYAGCCPRIS